MASSQPTVSQPTALAIETIEIAPATGPPQLDTISVTVDAGAIGIIAFNRPLNGNAINTLFLNDFLAALKWCAQQASIRILVLTGIGKFYNGGLDLLDPINQQLGTTISDEFLDAVSPIHEFLIQTDLLIITAVNGPAPGWGTSSVALSDLSYAVPDAIFFTPFVQWGLCTEGCSSMTFMRIMGRQKASALILAGQKFSAEEAYISGLITKVLPKEGFLDAVLKIARDVARLPPESLKANKRFLMKNIKEDLLRANREEMDFLRRQSRGKESLEAIGGFRESVERRKREAMAKKRAEGATARL